MAAGTAGTVTMVRVRVAMAGAPLLDCLSVLLSYKHIQVGLPALSPPCDWFGGVASHLQSLSSDFAPGKKKGLDSVVIELGTPENGQRAERIYRGVGWRSPPGLIQQEVILQCKIWGAMFW